MLVKYIEQQVNINNNLTKLITKVDQHIEQQNALIQQIYEVIKNGETQHATSMKNIPQVDKNFIQDHMEINIDNDTKLKLYGLHEHYVKLRKQDKSRTLIDYLGKLEFNRVVIFVKSASRCKALCKLLAEQSFPATETHHEIPQEQRLARYKQFKQSQTRILVATNLFEYGLNIERVNIIFNYDMPEDTNIYLQRVARAGRIGKKGLAITFVVDESDAAILNEIQSHFQVQITEMPDNLDADRYIENR